MSATSTRSQLREQSTHLVNLHVDQGIGKGQRPTHGDDDGPSLVVDCNKVRRVEELVLKRGEQDVCVLQLGCRC